MARTLMLPLMSAARDHMPGRTAPLPWMTSRSRFVLASKSRLRQRSREGTPPQRQLHGCSPIAAAAGCAPDVNVALRLVERAARLVCQRHAHPLAVVLGDQLCLDVLEHGVWSNPSRRHQCATPGQARPLPPAPPGPRGAAYRRSGRSALGSGRGRRRRRQTRTASFLQRSIALRLSGSRFSVRPTPGPGPV